MNMLQTRTACFCAKQRMIEMAFDIAFVARLKLTIKKVPTELP